MAKRRVLLVDDHNAFLDLGHVLLGHGEEMEIVGEATNGEEAIRLAAALKPDIVILDIQMPGLDGFQTARLLLKNAPDAKIILTSAFEDPEYNGLARAVGAVGFIEKTKLSVERVLALL